jgi:capsular polysaccharide biosynthesis protein
MVPYSSDISLRHATPAIELHRNSIYVPVSDSIAWEHDQRWGLYDEDGYLIRAAAYLRDGCLVGQSDYQSLDGLDLDEAPPGNYLYGGNMIAHFGHFLLSTLSRYWMGIDQDLSEYKILCHGAGVPEGWWSHRFIREIFSSVGLTVDNFVSFRRPTKVRLITVPHSSSEEHRFVNIAYAQWCNKVGMSLLRGKEREKNPTPIWLSKTRLPAGVQGLVNEEEITSRLEARGVEIIHPQDISVADQVKLFATRPAIIGTVGSAFHASVLWPPQARLGCVALYDQVSSNYAISDLSNKNNVHYIAGLVKPATGSSAGRFMDAKEIINVDEVVRQLLVIADL